MNSSEKVFYRGNTQFSWVGCRWIEDQSDLLGSHIHRALCGHGGERCVRDGKMEILVDGFERISNTVYQFYCCKWHGCTCLDERTERDRVNYNKTLEQEERIIQLGYKVVSVWEYAKPDVCSKRLEKELIPYPYFIVYDFETILKGLVLKQTSDFTINSLHVPVSVAVKDNFSEEASFIESADPKRLVELFVEDLSNRREKIVEKVKALYPIVDEKSLPTNVRDKWTQRINQVPVFGFNSGKYDLNMVKEFFVKSLSDMGNVKVEKKDNFYKFLSTPEYKFLDIKNYLTPGLSFDGWCKANDCKVN